MWWLLNPPTHKPTRSEFGLPEQEKVTASTIGAADSLEEGSIAGEVMEMFQREKRYAAALRAFNQYENWKATRNADRAALEAKHGYDTKHGMHLVRLLRMCREILIGEGVIVKRPDADELLAIRAGAWPYERLIGWAEEMDAGMDRLYEASTLPHSPDVAKLNALCVRAQEMFWSKQ